LTAIVHPAVFRLEEQLLKTASEQDPDGIFIVEAAILVETGRYSAFDRLILTTCDAETQIARAIARDGATREQALARISRQWSFEQKRGFASYIIDTTGAKEVTLEKVKDVYRDLLRLTRH
jgi:dephospho-CoA kinase